MSKPNDPIPLWKVLEEEYTHLHGPPTETYVAQRNVALQKGFSEAAPGQASEGDAAIEPNRAALRVLHRYIHNLPVPRSALCLSGGGIRSATFALGVLQSLAEKGLLEQFDYLSTVSGGGYIGAWLQAWLHNEPRGAQQVFDDLAGTVKPRPDAFAEASEIYHLRQYSNYLTPKLGFFSADTWTLVSIYFRNLLLNWFALIPWLAGALLLPRIYLSLIRWGPGNDGGWLHYICLVLALAFAIIAFGYLGMQRPSARKAQSMGADQNAFLMKCWGPLMASAILFTLFWAWGYQREIPRDFGDFVVVGLIIALGGWLLAAIRRHALKNPVELAFSLAAGLLLGCLTWILARWTAIIPSVHPELYTCFAAPILLLAFSIVGSVYVGLTSWRMDDQDREWWARTGAWVAIAIAVWVIVAGLVIFGPLAILKLPAVIAPLGGVAGIVSILLGKSSSTPASPQEAQKLGIRGWISQHALAIAGPIAIAMLLACLSLVTSWLLLRVTGREVSRKSLSYPESLGLWGAGRLTILAIGLGIFGFVTSGLVNLNRFSLHGTYRDRLIRAYLGASRPDRKPDRFTGFDPNDNISMSKLWPGPEWHGSPNGGARKLLHIINVTLNLVGDSDLAWQERKAESFTISPLHCGSARVGYRPSDEYGGLGQLKGGRGAISLGTAVTISGAAVSPNMGYNSSPAVTFLLTLFNVRLGCWLGNPAASGPRGLARFFSRLKPVYQSEGPRSAALPIVAEAFGKTDDVHSYVYLSDGGHFDNLGLYEMVCRRCRTIVVSDAGRDPDCAFADLGNAIRKIRIDLGVPIVFRGRIPIYGRDRKLIGKYCAIADILYDKADGKAAPPGTLIYLKPSLYGEEPADVYNYGQSSQNFPHESTADQWFSESQFESYRALGWYIMDTICPQGVIYLSDLATRVRSHIAAAPIITDLSPNSGPAHQHTAVTISGAGFVRGTIATFDKTPAVVAQLRGPTCLVVLAPPASPGSVNVTVTNPDGQSHRVGGAYTYR